MLDFSIRSNTKELLDGNNIPHEDIVLNMKELDTINTLLGGHSITLQGFKKLVGSRKKISILEIGCGGGDNLRVIKNYCDKHQIEVELWGVDINFDIANFARERNAWLNVVCADYQQVKLKTKPDIIFSSLFCHHFSNQELTIQLHWMKENATVGYFINDLQRHPLAYYSIKLLTRIFSSSYLVKNDAPLSVARGFKKDEWVEIFNEAGIQYSMIQWKWAFRYLITVK